MIKRVKDVIEHKLHARSLKRWQRATEIAGNADLTTLRNIRQQARQMRTQLDRAANIVEGRLIMPRIGSNAIRKPTNSDWTHRPEIWRGPIFPSGFAAVLDRTRIGTAATIYHDCSVSELTVRQMRNRRESDLAPFGLRLEVFQFDGNFLSLALDLPDTLLAGLRNTHVLRLTTEIETEKSLRIYARLNVKCGPNTEQMTMELPLNNAEIVVEFDLAHMNLNENRLERIWMDLIFNDPDMNEIFLRDVTFSRRPRAGY